jgi:hypothetical protein
MCNNKSLSQYINRKIAQLIASIIWCKMNEPSPVFWRFSSAIRCNEFAPFYRCSGIYLEHPVAPIDYRNNPSIP